MLEQFSNLLELFPVDQEITDVIVSGIKQPGVDRINPYYFQGINSNTLLVTVGDSWTWGLEVAGYHDLVNFQSIHWNFDAGCVTNINADRINNVYGNIISNTIGSDWLNLGIPGNSNVQMAKHISTLANLIPDLPYSKILIIVTLTEVGRWFNTISDIHINHNNIMTVVEQTNDPNCILAELNRNSVQQILTSISMFDHVDLLVGTNFVDAIGLEDLPLHQRLEIPWYKLLNISYPSAVYTHSRYSTTHFIRSIEDGLIPPHLHSIVKPWVLNLIDSEAKCFEIASQSEYIAPGGQLHTTKEGQKIWANYILGHLK